MKISNVGWISAFAICWSLSQAATAKAQSFVNAPGCTTYDRCTTPCGPPREGPPSPPLTPRPGPPEQPEQLQETGVFVAPPRTGVTQGGAHRVAIQGMTLTFPELKIGLPHLGLPSLVRTRSEPRMILDQAVAPYVVTGHQRVGPPAQPAAPREAPPATCEEKLRELQARYEQLEQMLKKCQAAQGDPAAASVPPVPDLGREVSPTPPDAQQYRESTAYPVPQSTPIQQPTVVPLPYPTTGYSYAEPQVTAPAPQPVSIPVSYAQPAAEFVPMQTQQVRNHTWNQVPITTATMRWGSVELFRRK